jgi:hypothetical protein
MTITLDLRRSGAELIVRRSLVYPGRDCLQYSRHLVISCIRSSCVQARDRPSGPAGPGISNSLVAWMFHLLSRMTCGASVIGAFALALTGLFGAIAYSVAQRHREMAIRLALGALPAQVRGLILREGAALIAAGLAIGSIGTLVAARMLASVPVRRLSTRSADDRRSRNLRRPDRADRLLPRDAHRTHRYGQPAVLRADRRGRTSTLRVERSTRQHEAEQIT